MKKKTKEITIQCRWVFFQIKPFVIMSEFVK